MIKDYHMHPMATQAQIRGYSFYPTDMVLP